MDGTAHTGSSLEQRAPCLRPLSASRLPLSESSHVYQCVKYSPAIEVLIFMLEIYYLMAYLFDFYYTPFIPLSEVIDLYLATLWIKRLHRSQRLIFPALPAGEAIPIHCCHRAALRGPGREPQGQDALGDTGHFPSVFMDVGRRLPETSRAFRLSFR